jgi:hypothetical protein
VLQRSWTAELVRADTGIGDKPLHIGERLTEVTLAVAFLLLEEATETKLVIPNVVDAAEDWTGAVVPAGADVADAALEEELPTCTAGPTSSCFPAIGSVLSPQLAPAPLSVLPYMRQML